MYRKPGTTLVRLKTMVPYNLAAQYYCRYKVILCNRLILRSKTANLAKFGLKLDLIREYALGELFPSYCLFVDNRIFLSAKQGLEASL
jgi:hypothetical protein